MAGWLFSVAGMVLFMVILGGLTRLTHSGLSMVEWKLFTGWIPPMNDADWGALFAKYQQSPEFHKMNPDMDVHGFKGIFWLEFIHRFWGRFLGFAFFLPFALFLLRGCVRVFPPLVLDARCDGVVHVYELPGGSPGRQSVSTDRVLRLGAGVHRRFAVVGHVAYCTKPPMTVTTKTPGA